MKTPRNGGWRYQLWNDATHAKDRRPGTAGTLYEFPVCTVAIGASEGVRYDDDIHSMRRAAAASARRGRQPSTATGPVWPFTGRDQDFCDMRENLRHVDVVDDLLDAGDLRRVVVRFLAILRGGQVTGQRHDAFVDIDIDTPQVIGQQILLDL
jgi:hypothetical protein